MRVQQNLITGEYERDDCAFFSSKEVKEAARENLDQNEGFLARYGWADEAVKIHLESAKEGNSFLVIYVPDQLSSDRAMNVVHRVPFEFAHPVPPACYRGAEITSQRLPYAFRPKESAPQAEVK